MVIIKINKVAITHLAMEIHFQTTDHVVEYLQILKKPVLPDIKQQRLSTLLFVGCDHSLGS